MKDIVYVLFVLYFLNCVLVYLYTFLLSCHVCYFFVCTLCMILILMIIAENFSDA